MATIIDFKDLSRNSRKTSHQPAVSGPAQLYLFTGVRYERQLEPVAEIERRRRKMTAEHDRKTS